jgi:hypothetical protein
LEAQRRFFVALRVNGARLLAGKPIVSQAVV